MTIGIARANDLRLETDDDITAMAIAHLRSLAYEAIDTWLSSMAESGLGGCIETLRQGRAEVLLALADDIAESADYFMDSPGPSTEAEKQEWRSRKRLIRAYDDLQMRFDIAPDDPYAPDPVNDDPND
jgi:hypothetical protein